MSCSWHTFSLDVYRGHVKANSRKSLTLHTGAVRKDRSRAMEDFSTVDAAITGVHCAKEEGEAFGPRNRNRRRFKCLSNWAIFLCSELESP